MIIFIVLLCLMVIFLYLLMKKNKIDKKMNDSLNKNQTLITLKDLLENINKNTTMNKLKPDEVRQIKSDIENLIEATLDGEIISNDELLKKYERINSHFTTIKESSSNELNRKNELIKKLNFEVANFKRYLDVSVLYPKEFLFTANKLEGRVLDLKESSIEKLPKLMNDIEKELLAFQNEMKHFYYLYNRLKTILAKEIEISGNQKQEIYFHLQNGELDKAENLFNLFLADGISIEAEKEIEK